MRGEVPARVRRGCSLAVAVALGSATATTWARPATIELLGGRVMERWDTREGLPQASATSIAQAPDGRLWIGTFEGLVRFDGDNFEVLDHAHTHALPSNAILRLLQARDGRLWICTDRGVVALEDGAIATPPGAEDLAGGAIEAIVEDARGRIAISGPGLRLTLIDRGSARRLELPAGSPGEALDSIGLTSSSGRIYAERGAFVYLLGEDDRWERIGELATPILALGARRAGGVFASDAFGVWAVEPHGSTLVARHDELRHGDYGGLFEASGGDLWVTSYVGGVTVYRAGHTHQRFTRALGFPHDSTRFAFEDRAGTLWIGTDGAGLVSLREPAFRSYGLREGLPTKVVRAVLEEAPGRWLVATHGGGVVPFEAGRFGPRLGASLTGEPLSWVWALHRARDGALWLGFFGDGVTRIRGGTLERLELPGAPRPTVRAFAEGAGGEVWIATEVGVFVWTGGPQPISAVPLSGGGEKVTTLLATRGGILAGTDGRGLWRLRAPGEPPVHVETPAGDREITALSEDSRGALWLAAEGGHLLRLRDGADPLELDPEDGLPAARIRGIADDGRGTLWLATNRGVARFTLEDLDRYLAGREGRLHVHRMDAESGLPNGEVNAVTRVDRERSDGGDLVFSTLDGISVLTPAALLARARAPEARFEALEVLDVDGNARRWSPSAVEELDPGVARLVLHYTVDGADPVSGELEITRSGKTSLHAMEGRSFDLPYPEPGRYHFALTAVGRSGVRSAPITLDVLVRAPLWQRPGSLVAASSVAILLVAAAITSFFRKRLRRAQENVARERHLRELEERDRQLLETAQSLIWALDAAGRWEMVTRASEPIYGRRPEELLGRPFTDVSTDVARDRSFIERLRLQDTPADHSTIQRRADGGEVHLRFKAVARRDASGAVVGYAGTAIDVTEEQRARAIEEQVRRRMVESQRLESLGLLAGGIALDFNNLLTTTLLNVDYLRLRVSGEPEVDESLAAIDEASNRAAVLCRQMLAYTGRGRGVLKSVELSELIDSCAQLVRAAAAPDVSIELQLDRALPPIKADPAQLRQVVMNLLVNGAEAIGESSGRVLVETFDAEGSADRFAGAVVAPQDPRRRFAVVAISDRGQGMDAETLARIWDPFFTTKEPGRGLGLASVLGIVRGHGGALFATSRAGHGSRFEVWFPVVPAPLPSAAPPPRPPPRGAMGTIALVADDDPAIRSALARTLSRRGITVLEAEHGGVALDRFSPGRFHVVFLDVRMSVLGGLEVMERILERAPKQKVVLMSGFETVERRSSEASTSAFAFLGKPFRVEDVDRVVDAILDLGPAHPSTRD